MGWNFFQIIPFCRLQRHKSRTCDNSINKSIGKPPPFDTRQKEQSMDIWLGYLYFAVSYEFEKQLHHQEYKQRYKLAISECNIITTHFYCFLIYHFIWILLLYSSSQNLISFSVWKKLKKLFMGKFLVINCGIVKIYIKNMIFTIFFSSHFFFLINLLYDLNFVYKRNLIYFRNSILL